MLSASVVTVMLVYLPVMLQKDYSAVRAWSWLTSAASWQTDT